MGSLLKHSLMAADMISEWCRPSAECAVGVCLCLHIGDGQAYSQCRCSLSSVNASSCTDKSIPAHGPAQQCRWAGSEVCSSDGIQHQGMCCISGGAAYDGGCNVISTGQSESGVVCLCSHGGAKQGQHTQETSNEAAEVVDHVSPASTAAIQACSLIVPELKWTVIHVYPGNRQNELYNRQGFNAGHHHSQHCSRPEHIYKTDVNHDAACGHSMQSSLQDVLLDDEWLALDSAHVIVLDAAKQQQLFVMQVSPLAQGSIVSAQPSSYQLHTEEQAFGTDRWLPSARPKNQGLFETECPFIVYHSMFGTSHMGVHDT